MLSSKPLYTARQALRRPVLQSQAHLQRGLSTSSALSKGTAGHGPKALLLDKQQGLGFAKSNALPQKPRKRGVTEIRGPYYAVMGKRYLSDIFETLKELIDIAHENGAYVSTSTQHKLSLCRFDVVELSAGFLSIPEDDWLRLIEKVQSYGLKPKPELGIQFGAGGGTELEAIGTSDPGKLINLGKKFLDAGVERLMIESEGITENVTNWRTDVVSQIMKQLPQEKVMFEAADPKVFSWYIREFGIDVNLFVDNSQIVQLSCLRRGIWGTADTWGKIVSYRPDD
ncbi:uncharacterized protein ARB_06501 [Trichophyton benhamiae CBS 112371]|uniref:Sulfonate biosynthesis enzyme n=1 Tax=Arthroderma benhamiae (strain ATCC MYA-4681 / CBS 112371) TaxID=663331 RepID=D4AQJ4_ARTBC|nr:uncharacterized protein ARB_06501 [Trichophyton benhamiae CBS 112371]EFE34738.1 hypothetical protein ARB_06501 [Trichophyton benhamiae CBS 112371]